MQFAAVGASDVGRQREQNEDKHLVDHELGLFIVSDGMGGHAAGEVASGTAVRVVHEQLRSQAALVREVVDGGRDARDLAQVTEAAVQAACAEVYRMATSKAEHAGMGCTLTMLVAAGDKAVMGHVGDTRLYLLRSDESHLLSADHTLPAELARRGALDPSEVKNHPYSSVLTRSIGTQPAVQVDTLIIDVMAGDRLLLCSDGLSEYLEDPSDVVRELSGPPIDEIPGRLVAFANEGGGHDNVTAIVIEVEPAPPTVEDGLPTLEDVPADAQINLDALASVFLFEDLPLSHHARLLDACAVRWFDTGQTVVAAGNEVESLFVVADGTFLLQQDGETVAKLEPGDHVGAATLLRPRPARTSLVAESSGRLLELGAAQFRRVGQVRPWLGVALLEGLGRWLSQDDSREELVPGTASASLGDLF